jgi:L-ribulose-5-phosphate 4-epimerase
MTVEALRQAVYEANIVLARSGLVLGTFGNVSGADYDSGLFAIKPSGVPYERLSPADIVLVSIETGEVVDSSLQPSSDTPTHLELYRAFTCGGIAHTHSECATALAQARLPVRCMGTTQADYFHGDVPVTRPLSADEVGGEYERNTGVVIVETFRAALISPDEVPGVLVANHGPFTWGADAAEAVDRSRVLEWLARMDVVGRTVAPDAARPAQYLVDRHYSRKHGASAYYGQGKKS